METVININDERTRLQEECLAEIEKAGFDASFFLPTGVGKARILVEAAKRLYELGLITSITYVCDNREMRDEDFPSQMKLWGASHLIPITTCLCYATAHKMQAFTTDLRIFDEADYAIGGEKLRQSFEKIQARFTLLCSASGTDAQRVEINKIAPIVFERSLREVEQRGIINKSKYFFIDYLLTKQENKRYIELTKNISIAMAQKQEYPIQMATLERKHFLGGLLSSRLATKEMMKYIRDNFPKSRILVFSQLTEQVDKIVLNTFHEKNAKDDKLTLFNDLKIHELGVVGKIIRGKNLNGVDHLIHEGFNSNSTRMLQATGRGKRLEVEQFSNNYFMVPHFVKPSNNKVYSTVVEDWLIKAVQKLNIEYFSEHWITY